TVVSLGCDIPERIWGSQLAEWHRDISTAQTHVPLQPKKADEYHIKTAMRTAFGIPIIANEQTLAVLVFYSQQAIEENKQLVDSIHAMSIPIGMLVQQWQAETALKESKAKLASEKELAKVTLQSIGDAVITTDANGYIQSINPVAESLTGWLQEEAIGQPLLTIFTLIHETTREPIVNLLDCAVTAQTTADTVNHVRLITRRKDGINIEASVAPLQTDDGRLLGNIIVFHRASKTRQLARQLTWQTRHDALTGLLNRKEFERRVRQAVDNASTHHKSHALCYIDLDNFKIVNDTFGHSTGDELLKQIGQLLRKHIRTADTVARLGGDEFGLLLEYCSLGNASRVVHEVKEDLKTLRTACHGKTLAVGASVGVTAITRETSSAAMAMSNVETACHLAKRKGSNRVHIHQLNDVELDQQRDEIQWAAYISEALETGQFRLFFQSILSIDPACPSAEHYEVLLRLRNPTGVLVSPSAFMPAAERYNLMPLIDRWVVTTLFSTQALHYQHVWSQTQLTHDCDSHLYSVNLSGASINDDEFIDFLKAQFVEYKIPPELICFEITETAAIENLEKATQFIDELRSLGCQFALDDFGSGMSSFAYLKALPVDYLKIDGRFIQNILNDKIDTAMVTAIHQMAEVMNIRTVAEFVENEDILNRLKTLGISYAQGYGIAKPEPL
ncbi:MAG: EAL domain-containing protein, partial [Phormidesmis sp. RL_2_1]|nr:EAL domain-containing protein [Phormidesmis sp. RL_2_1]